MDVIGLLEMLVSIDSVNTTFGGPGEAEVAERVASVLADLGCTVRVHEVAPGRPNVVAWFDEASPGPRLLLEGHLDTVPQPREPILVRRTDGRLHGRGACDAKGSVAAMVATMARLADRARRPAVVFAGVADEEALMGGSRALLAQLPSVHGAIVGEPTSLGPARTHNGLVRFRIVARGRAAHTSRANLGVNAIAAAARVVLAIENDLGPRLAARVHPLSGPALVTPAVIHGGSAVNLVPDWCEIEVDRRLAPGEDPGAALREIDALLDTLRANGDDIVREEPTAAQLGLDMRSDHPLVRATERAAGEVLGRPERARGVPFGTDAANLAGIGGIPCVVLGPGSIDQAHSADEWVDLREVERAVDLYERIVDEFADMGKEVGA
ncbi:MAG: M20/M25/M40 family metallo-hydrolase [Chloroflexi bacterium]|nr:M20/M25/M40 family metallo-hydrolase [Chloroflexota bacterium]